MKAYLSIATEGASSLEIGRLIEKLRGIQSVLIADAILGKFNIIAIVETSDSDTLRELTSQLHAENPIITQIETSIVTQMEPVVGG